jgi:hypothetical protein
MSYIKMLGQGLALTPLRNQMVKSIINRYYDPATDEFMSIDPDVATTDQPYVFTNDDPLNAEDPLGENIWSTIAKGVAIVLGITAIIVVVVVVVISGDEGGSASEDGVQIIKDGNGNDSGGSSESGGDHGTFSLNFSDPSTPPGEDWAWKGVRRAPVRETGSTRILELNCIPISPTVIQLAHTMITRLQTVASIEYFPMGK